MVYTSDDEYGKHRGYDDFADFVSDNTIPSDTGLEEIRKRANVLVNVAFHHLESDSTTFTILLGHWEMLVIDRILYNDYQLDALKDGEKELLTEKEVLFLRQLNTNPVLFSVRMLSDQIPMYGGVLW